jgi:hypothetical protein
VPDDPMDRRKEILLTAEGTCNIIYISVYSPYENIAYLNP